MKAQKVQKPKPVKFTLNGMTCEQFADWLEAPFTEGELQTAYAIKTKQIMAKQAPDLRALKTLPASRWKSLLAALGEYRRLAKMPKAKLKVGGGRPSNSPRLTVALAAIGKIHGDTIYAYGSHSFILDTNP